MGFDSLSSRLRDSLSLGNNKPDSKEHDLGSPVSPLMTGTSVNDGNAGVGVKSNAFAAKTSSSSSSSSGSVSGKTNPTQLSKRSDCKPNNHSGELSGMSETSPSDSESLRSDNKVLNSRPGHRRSVSAGPALIYSGKNFSSNGTTNVGTANGANSVSSNLNSNVLPSGNILPPGKVLKAGVAPRTANRTDVLGSGTGNYGHGSIVRGGPKLGSSGNNSNGNAPGNVQLSGETVKIKKAMLSSDPEEVKIVGNEFYRRGNFAEALSLYDRAILISPENAAYRSNRAAALTALGRLGEAVKECEEAVRLDPVYGRAHHRLAALYIRFGQVQKARSHLFINGIQPDQSELQKLKLVEKHLNQCANARKTGDWKSAIREADAAVSAGADTCPQLAACKAEALLKLNQLDDAECSLSSIPRMGDFPASCAKIKSFDMVGEAFVFYVRAHVEMAMGRFETAIVAAEKAGMIDCDNLEVTKLLFNVKMVARARSRGNDLFCSGRYDEACTEYEEGLKYDSSNSILYCNRAVCWSKLGQWQKSVEDCSKALKIQPNYRKALLRRAASYVKLERWAEAVRDYEVLNRQLPGDSEIAESLHRAGVALKKSQAGELNNTGLGREIEKVSTLDKFRDSISSPGVSVIHFKVESSDLCEEISLFINGLCTQYPSVKFFKVDVEENAAVARAESIRATPTLKIYKNGEKLIEMIRPSHQLLEDSIRSCIL